jgi:hypothetical protein
VTAVDYAPKERKQLWKAAIKLPMYSVGVVPVLVSSPAAAATGPAGLPPLPPPLPPPPD